MNEKETRLSWVEEMPVPSTNLRIHFEGYVIEQWLRRITLAALMAKAGSQWIESIPGDLLPEAKKQVKLLHRRTFLDPENSDNLVWALTVDQLRRVLTEQELSSFVFELTGMSRRDLERELSKFRDIRNIVAHHRATNSVAMENFALVSERLRSAIQTFKLRLLYYESVDALHHAGGEPDGELASLFESSGLATDRWFLLFDRDRFYEFGVVWGDPALKGGFVDVASTLDLFHDVRHAVLCIQLPHSQSEGYEGELAVVWPKDVSPDELVAIRDACLLIRRDTAVPYENQDPKHICDPLIWFEQGYKGAAAAGSASAQERLDAWNRRTRDAGDQEPPF